MIKKQNTKAAICKGKYLETVKCKYIIIQWS